MTISDTDRAIQHNPDQSYPDSVRVEMVWTVDGQPVKSAIWIGRDEFFGLGAYGAPIEGAALIGRIENLRRAGPPLGDVRVPRRLPTKSAKKVKNAKKR